MGMGPTLARRLKRHRLGILLLLVLVYFSWSMVHGERGLIAWSDLGRTLEAKRYELDGLEARREALEARVGGLRPEAIDQDTLESELYARGYVGEDEVIVLEPTQE